LLIRYATACGISLKEISFENIVYSVFGDWAFFRANKKKTMTSIENHGAKELGYF
jgi:hypothetical protein